MKLIIFNGSPKAGVNNTDQLVNSFVEGFQKNKDNHADVFKLNGLLKRQEAIQLYEKADNIIFAFPMYNFSIPVALLEFLNELETVQKACPKKNIGFIVQYGYLEAEHARPLERYLKFLVQELFHSAYIGTVIRGASDSLAERPYLAHNKRFCDGIREIGRRYGIEYKFNKSLLKEYAKPENQFQISLKNKIIIRFFKRRINKKYMKGKILKNGISVKASMAKPYQ